MSSFGLEMLGVITLSTIIGVLTSYAINKYSQAGSRAERIADQIKGALQKALFPVLYPSFFNPETALAIFPDQPAPRKTDTPHVDCARFVKKRFYPNEKIDVLIKVVDSGFDLVNPTGIKVRDHKDNSLGVVSLGLGFVLTTFHTTVDDRPGAHKLTVELRDLGEHTGGIPNQNIQTFSFTIVEPKTERYNEEHHRKSQVERQRTY
jgi:hypothetical protein